MNDKGLAPGSRIPQPAHPDLREQPLPWHRPKPSDEESDAPCRVQAILASPSYRLAEQDCAFFERDEVRGLRLQAEYLKPELLLREQGIRDTVVVYGRTRISEPAAAAPAPQLRSQSRLTCKLLKPHALILDQPNNVGSLLPPASRATGK